MAGIHAGCALFRQTQAIKNHDEAIALLPDPESAGIQLCSPLGWGEQSETYRKVEASERWVSLRSTHPTRAKLTEHFCLTGDGGVGSKGFLM